LLAGASRRETVAAKSHNFPRNQTLGCIKVEGGARQKKLWDTRTIKNRERGWLHHEVQGSIKKKIKRSGKTSIRLLSRFGSKRRRVRNGKKKSKKGK